MTLVAAPEQAVADGSSPFAGCYSYSNGSITISGGGRISGSSYAVRLSGRIWGDGYIELTEKFSYFSIDGKSAGTITRTAVGFGSLDADGNLYGVLELADGSITDFFWPRCG